jgi:hypothetical protein
MNDMAASLLGQALLWKTFKKKKKIDKAITILAAFQTWYAFSFLFAPCILRTAEIY